MAIDPTGFEWLFLHARLLPDLQLSLMAQALAFAWRKDVERLWVHTCTLDHPTALGFYRRHGFVPYKRTIETFPDPRLLGVLPADAAPHIPCLGSVAR